MKHFKSRYVLAVVVLLPVLLFVLMKHLYVGPPSTACAELLAALKRKDEVSLEQLATPQGLALMRTFVPAPYDPMNDWLSRWQAWAVWSASNSDGNGAFEANRSRWVWSTTGVFQGLPITTRLYFVRTRQGWKLYHVADEASFNLPFTG